MGIVDRLLDRHAQYGPRSLEVRAADLIERLKGYAKHGPMCLTLGKDDCRCGLSALIKEIEGD